MKLIHGDCIDYMRSMPDNSVDLILTDPPYGLQYDKKAAMSSKKKYGNAAAGKKDYGVTDWDHIPDKIYFDEMLRVSRNSVIFGAEHLSFMLPRSRGWIVWDKQTGATHFSDCELAYTTFDRPVKKITYTWNGMIQQNMADKEERFHPTQKPVDLFAIILETYAKSGSSIMDCFSGVGTTGLACERLGIKDYTLIEKDEKYYNIACERIDKEISQLKLF